MGEIDNKKSVTKYRKKMFQKTSIFTNKNDKKAKASVQKEMDQVLAFEKKLIKVSVDFSIQIS